jgi:hypothetical protein
VATAILIRGAGDGAVVGLVVLAGQVAGADGPLLGGALGAALVFPHVIGPWVGRLLHRAADGRRMLAAGFAGYAILLLVATALITCGLPVPGIVATAAAGVCGPFINGGLSSRLASLAGTDLVMRRRAAAWDSITYGIGTVTGPAAVAAVAGLLPAPYGPPLAMLAVGTAALTAAGMTFLLPVEHTTSPGPATDSSGTGITSTARIGPATLVVLRLGPLRRIAIINLIAGIGYGTFPVAAPLVGANLTGSAAAGATLISAYGFGSLLVSVTLAAFPLTFDPERIATRALFAVALAVVAAALVGSYPLALLAFAVIGMTTGCYLVAFLAAPDAYAAGAPRVQAFVVTSSLKILSAAVGSLAAGALGTATGHGILLIAAAVILAATATATLDRYCTRQQRFARLSRS